MCRNIKILFNFEPPATEQEMQDAALQFVRKLSGTTSPSKPNEQAFNKAVADITCSIQLLLNSMVTVAKPKNREDEIAKAKRRNVKRFGNMNNI